MIGFCSFSGGLSSASNSLYSIQNDDHKKNAYQSLSGGFGDMHLFHTLFF